VKSNLVIRCAHVVVEPDLISGVLTARNGGKQPLSVVDRWNSWGAYQWRLAIGTLSAGNPQHDWWANFYTETSLEPGEIRHARFYMTRSPNRVRLGEDAWCFLVEGAGFFLSTSSEVIAALPPFARGQAVTLVMDGKQTDAPDSDRTRATDLWGGQVTVRSDELKSIRELEDRITGKELQ
jgi:hypothetical protein